MSDSDGDQTRFTEDGKIEEPDDDEDGEGEQNDFGEEMPWYETSGGFRRDVISSLFQKAVRRSDVERAGFAAWELVRSGPKYETHYWNRAILACLEDLAAGNEALEHVQRYEELAKNRYEDNGWVRKLCAIAAAFVCARAHSSRETTHANGVFDTTMKDRAKSRQDEDHDPLYDPPVTDEELSAEGKIGSVAVDQHTYPGSARGRDWKHFRIEGSRIGPEEDTELGARFRRMILEYEQFGFREHEVDHSEEEIDHSATATDADDPWGGMDEDRELDEFDQ